jgi:hypothetical protein
LGSATKRLKESDLVRDEETYGKTNEIIQVRKIKRKNEIKGGNEKCEKAKRALDIA